MNPRDARPGDSVDREYTVVTPPVLQPEVFGKYYLIDRIAIGGMAEIFRAKTYSHQGFEKLQVVKRILSHLSQNGEFVEMFADEAKVSVALQHANIVQTYDFGRIRDNFFIAMEFVEGKDVKALLRKLSIRRKLLPIEFAIFIAHEVCKGLDYAHRRGDIQGNPLGIVHRDMSPSNVIVSYEGEVKIADFGIAKAAINTYNTKDGVLKGKFEYMSPEQASGGDVDRRTDLFCTGIILWECLTGRRLFKTSSDVKTLEKVKSCDIDPPSALNPAIPARLDDIVMKALTRDPAHRYQDAREFQNDLLEFLYPATPDLTRQSLAHFLHELFSEEIADEHTRLEAGSRLAAELYAQAPEVELEPSWEEGGPSTGTLRTEPSRVPLYVALLSVVLIVGVVGIVLVWLAIKPPAVDEIPPDAAITVQVAVPAVVMLDGVKVGEGSLVTMPKVAPGPHDLEVKADGYQSYVEQLELAPGDQVRMPIRLEKIEEAETPPVRPPPQPEPGATWPTVRFESSPSGATILVDGRVVGQTPMTWTAGRPGGSARVEYRMDGREPTSFTVSIPRAGEASREAHSLKEQAGVSNPPPPTPPPTPPPQAAGPGKVSVNVSPGWAHVYIDGAKVKDTPLLNYELSAGKHTIRVVNPDVGLDQSRSVTISSGSTERVTFSVK